MFAQQLDQSALPQRPTNSAIPPGNFEMLSRLNKLDLCGLFLTEWQLDLDHYLVLKKSAQVQLIKLPGGMALLVGL